jgi:hypothetical protein
VGASDGGQAGAARPLHNVSAGERVRRQSGRCPPRASRLADEAVRPLLPGRPLHAEAGRLERAARSSARREGCESPRIAPTAARAAREIHKEIAARRQDVAGREKPQHAALFCMPEEGLEPPTRGL